LATAGEPSIDEKILKVDLIIDLLPFNKSIVLNGLIRHQGLATFLHVPAVRPRGSMFMRIGGKELKSLMPERQQERRRMARLALEVLVKIEAPGSGAQFFAETRNVSAQGIYLRTQKTGLQIGQELECVLVLPEKLTLASKPSFVNCRGKIIRLTTDPADHSLGVALEVSSFDFSVQSFPPANANHA